MGGRYKADPGRRNDQVPEVRPRRLFASASTAAHGRAADLRAMRAQGVLPRACGSDLRRRGFRSWTFPLALSCNVASEALQDRLPPAALLFHRVRRLGVEGDSYRDACGRLGELDLRGAIAEGI